MSISFIGLGAMGSAIAGHLLAGGQDLTVWNRSAGPAEALAASGARVAQTSGDAFAAADVVFSMLSEDKVVEQVILASGALDRARPGSVHVNHATISVALAERLEAEHQKRGLGYVAAPVLGRPEVAQAGALNVMLAGRSDAVERVRPLIERFAKTIWPLGEAAARANVVKIACNFAIASAIETLGEAGALVSAHGVAPAALYEVMTSTIFDAPVYKTYAGLIEQKRFSPAGFALPLGLKDVRLALQAGDDRNAPLPLASLLRDHFIEAIAHGDGDKDWSALSAVALRHAGLASD